MNAITAGVLLAILCGIVEGTAQVCFKQSVLKPDRRRRWLGAGAALFTFQALLYTGALEFVEVSTAFPIISIGFVVVVILSRRFLNEPVTRARWIGVGFIIVGVTLLGAHA